MTDLAAAANCPAGCGARFWVPVTLTPEPVRPGDTSITVHVTLCQEEAERLLIDHFRIDDAKHAAYLRAIGDGELTSTEEAAWLDVVLRYDEDGKS